MTMDEELRRTLDALPALVASLDPELRYEFANAAHARWFGIAAEAAAGLHLWDVIGPELRALLQPAAQRALAGETVDVEVELPASIRLRWVRMSITPELREGAVARLHYLVTDLGRERALERQLERSDAIFNAVFAVEGVGKALVSREGVIERVNPAFAAMLGHVPEALTGRHFVELTHPDDIDADLHQFAALNRGEIDGYRLEKRYIGADGEPVDTLLVVSMVRATARLPDFYVSQIIDVRDRKAAEQHVRERNAQLGLALDLVDAGVWQYDLTTAEMSASSRLVRGLGLPEDRPLSKVELLERVHPDDMAGLRIDLRAPNVDEPTTTTFRFRGADGEWMWLRWRRQLVRDNHGAPKSVLGIVMDVTEERQREAQLTKAAITDSLTGLVNRRGFDAALVKAMRPLRDARPALLLVDLDRFKPINDAHGHITGDRVLREVSRRLRAAVRAGDVAARLGGDEFAVLLKDVDRPAAEAAAARIVATLSEPCQVGRIVADIGASVGVAMASAWDDSCTLVKRADEALYAVKRAGRGAWKVAA